MIAQTSLKRFLLPGMWVLWLAAAGPDILVAPASGDVLSPCGPVLAVDGEKPKPPPIQTRPQPKTSVSDRRPDPEQSQPNEEQIDPVIEKQLEELLGSDPSANPENVAQRAAASRRRAPPKRAPKASGRTQETRAEDPRGVDQESPGADRGEDDESGSTTLNIPPIDGSVPPEERVYSFSIKDGTYEQLIEGVARQTGLGVLGEAPKGGKVTFVTDEQLTFDELLARVRMLLFNYKPHEPYWLDRKETHLEVLRVPDLYRTLPRDRMFRNVEEYRAANLSESELCLVLYTPKSGSVADMQVVRDFMPDYMRVTPFEDKNTVMIFGLTSDINKYFEVKDFVAVSDRDPRTLERIPVEHITATEAVAQLSELMDLDGGGGGARQPTRPAGRRDANPLESIREPEVNILPVDALKIIIVRAMKDKIEEIKSLLPLVDVPTEVTYDPVIIDVKYANPDDLVSDIQQILTASSSSASGTSPQAPRRQSRNPRQKGAAQPAGAVTADEITLMSHPTRDAIIVMAPEEDVARVRKYAEMFDVQTQVERVPIELEHVGAGEIIATLENLLNAGGTAKGQSPEGPQLVPDLSGSVIWFSGTEKDLQTVREMVKLMDVPEDPVTLHIIRLVNQKPSFVADILKDYIAGGVQGTGKDAAKPAPRRGKTTRKASRAGAAGAETAKFKPDDEQGRLFVLCTDAEWEEYLVVIEQLEGEVPIEEGFVRIPVEHIDPEEAISKITALMGGDAKGKKPAQAVIRFESTDDAILVMGATDREVERIKELLAQFDQPIELEQRTFQIKYGDPAEISKAVRTLVGGVGEAGGKPKGRGKSRPKAKGAGEGAGSDDLTIVELGDRLIVQAAPGTMKEVAALIEEFDVEEKTSEIRVYKDFSPGSDIAGIAETLAENFGGAKGPRGRAKKDKTEAVAPEFIPQPEAGRLVVVAPPEMFADIEDLLVVLRTDVPVSHIEVAFIDVEFADPGELVEQIEPLLALRVEQLIRERKLAGIGAVVVAPAKGAKEPKKRGPAQEGSGGSLFHIDADEPNSRIVIAAPPIVIEEARKLAAQFDLEGIVEEDVVLQIVPVEHGDPAQLVETIEPLLALRVQYLERIGKLSASAGEVTPTQAKPDANVKRRSRASRGTGRESDRYHLAPDTQNGCVVVAGPQLVVDEAVKLIAKFDRPTREKEPIEFVFVDVEYADPEALVDAIEPLLEIKVLQMMDTGELPEDVEVSAAPAPRKGGKGSARSAGRVAARYHLEPDVRNRRVAIAASQPIIDEATQLIAQFDRPVDDGLVFETIDLEHADPADIVKVIGDLMGSQTRTTRRKAKGGPTPPTDASAGTFTIVERPGGGAVVCRGVAEDVEQARRWIEKLDVSPISDRVIKTYEIKYYDVSQLVDLIMADVDAAPAPAKKKGTPARARLQEPEEDEDEFETVKTRIGTEVYVQANLIDDTMVVSAPRAKIARVDAIVAQLDTEEEAKESRPTVPKREYALQWADAFDASFDLEMLLEAIWKGELPKVDYLSFGDFNLLIVEYPDESRFPEIEELITKFIDRPGESAQVKRKVFAAPAGVTPGQMIQQFQTEHPEIEFEIVDISDTVQETYGMEIVLPTRSPVESPCVLPAAFQRMTDALVAGAVWQVDPGSDEEDAGSSGEEEAVDTGSAEDEAIDVETFDNGPPIDSDEMIRDMGRAMLEGGTGEVAGESSRDETGERPAKGKGGKSKKLKIHVDELNRVVYIEGPGDIVNDVPDWIKKVKDDANELPVPPPDIRIYRVKYIDVFTASDIINEMFNATQQQRQQLQVQQQQARQQQMQQQRQLQRQQQGRGQQQGQQQQQGQPPEQPGQQGQRGRQAQPVVAQLPPPAVRVKANERDRTLILRAEANQFPALLKLLATIDQPKPVDSKHRIYPLKKLNAIEVEALLEDWLGLNEVRSRAQRTTTTPASSSGRRTQPPRTTSTGEPAGTLPRTIMQRTVTGSELGVDPKDIQVSSNEVTNTILVMAPEAALDYIGELIDELESHEVPERIWKDYELEYADVEQVAEYLTNRYEEEATPAAGQPSTSRKGSGGRRGPTSSKPTFATPTFIAYPRLKLLSAQATEEVIQEIDELIARLDVDLGDDQFKSIKLRYADAETVAETLTAMFGVETGGRQSSRGQRGRSDSTPTDLGPKFIGEPGGTVLYYRAPAALHERIATVVEELEGQSAYLTTPRVILLEHARPSDVAEAIEQAYGAGSGASTSRRGSKSRSTPQAGGPRFTVAPDDATKRLFVVAPKELADDIESLAKILDEPRKLDFQFKIYPLQYADARRVFTTMGSLITDYVRQLGRDEKREPFSVEVDEKANALIVLGGPMVFAFVEGALEDIDIAANAASPPSVLMIPIKNADASELAQNITQLWAKRDPKSTEEPPIAQANKALNMLIVRGTQDQIDEIKRDVIDPLEQQTAAALMTETLPLAHVRAEDVAETIIKFFEDRKTAMKERGRDGRQPPAHEMTVVVTPDAYTNQLIVQASEDNMKFIKEQLAKVDTEEVATTIRPVTKVYPVGNADSAAVVNIIKEWTQSRDQRKGGRDKTASPRDVVTAVAEPFTQTVVVTASPENHILIDEMLKSLNDPERVDLQKSHVVRIENADAGSVATTLNEIFVKSSPRSKTGAVPPISISALQGSNSILIKCNDEDFTEIAAAIEQLDSAEDEAEEVRVVMLKYGDATEVYEALKEHLRKPGSASGRGATDLVGDVRLAVLSQGNAIVVSGDKERVEGIESVIHELDENVEEGSVPQIIALKYAKVGQVLASLQEVFSEQKGRRSDLPPPVIVGNDVLNALVVRASLADFTAIASMVERLDIPEAKDKPNFKLIPVAPSMNVEDLAITVETSVNRGAEMQHRGGRDALVPSITVTPDKRIQAVVVAGSPLLFDDAEKLIRAMEETSGERGGVGIRLITLKNRGADDIIRVIEQLKGESVSGTRAKRSGSTSGSGSSSRSGSRRPSTRSNR